MMRWVRHGWSLGLLVACEAGDGDGRGAPDLVEEPVLEAPAPDEDGVARAREGTRVSIRIQTRSPLDLSASSILLGGALLFCEPGAEGETVYRCDRLLDGSEDNGPVGLSGSLVGQGSGESARLVSGALVTLDFLPPTARCALTPRSAQSANDMGFTVTPSEPLADVPEVVASVPEISVSFVEFNGSQYVYDLASEADLNVDGFTLQVTAEDLAGNPQEGDSLCAVEERSGSVLTDGPALVDGVDVEATPSVNLGGVPWVREGAEVRVRMPTVAPIDVSRSTASLSGLSLTPDPLEVGSWVWVTDGSEPEGLQRLHASLEDAAGNVLAVERTGVVGFDFTPPTASCVLNPEVASGQQTVSLVVVASEALAGGAPSVVSSDPRVTVGAAQSTGNRHAFPVFGTAGQDVDYTLTVTGEDLVGNVPAGPLCDPSSTSGRILAAGPVLIGEPQISVTPSVSRVGVPWARAGAEVRVTLVTDEAVDPGASTVSLSGLALTPDLNSPGAWTRVIDGSEPEGLQLLSVALTDAAGNTLSVQREGVVGFDFTPPRAACALSPVPARPGDAITFTLDPFQVLGGPPTLSSSDSRVQVGAPQLQGGRWVASLTVGAVPSGGVLYTVGVEAVDDVGNVGTGDQVCPAADRTGQVVP